MVNPKTGKNRLVEGAAALVAYKQDLIAHQQGTGFRHDADAISMDPLLTRFSQDNVQDVLASMNDFLISAGSFVTIGDGYSIGTYNVGTDGTVEECLQLALTQLGSAGGTIFFKPGVYNFATTTTLPANVCITGDISSAILNATTDNPIFLISETSALYIDNGNTIKPQEFASTRLYNLIFADNYNNATAVLLNNGFIKCNRGSQLFIERCSVFGKKNASNVSKYFVYFDNGTVSDYGTIVDINNSYISCVRQIIDFDIDVSKDNKLRINNNRLWFTGISTSNYRTKSGIAFAGTDITVINNNVIFGVHTEKPATHLLSCYSDPGKTCNMIITGNTFNAYTGLTLDPDNNIIRCDTDVLNKFKSIISNNAVGGYRDGQWYITVGDGINSVGDINGAKAVQYVSNLVTSNLGTNRKDSVIILVKYGSYTMDGTKSSAIYLPIIGIPSNHNLPTLNISVNHTFYARLENLNITSGNSKFYSTTVDVDRLYNKHTVVRNCYFHNTGLYFSSSSGSNDTLNEVIIEECKFSTTSSVVGLDIKDQTIIQILPVENTKYTVKNCRTVSGSFYSKFIDFSIEAISTMYNFHVELDSCSIYFSGGNVDETLLFKIANNINYLTISNCVIDYSGSGVGFTRIIRDHGDLNATISNIIIENNVIIGNGENTSGSKSTEGIWCDYCDFVKISNNTFRNIGLAAKVLVNKDSAKIIVSDNKFYDYTTSYGLCMILGGSPNSTSRVNVNVENNSLEYQAASPVFPNNDLANSTLAPIFVDTTNSVVVVKNNTVFGFYANYTDIEGCIGVVNAANAFIENNTVFCTNNTAARDLFVIFASYNELNSETYIERSEVSSVVIRNNYINCTGTTNKENYIYERDYANINITNNTLISFATDPAYFIYCKYTGEEANPICEGTIRDNILRPSTAIVNGGGIYFQSVNAGREKIICESNKGQIAWKDILCTEFLQYGPNTTTTPYSKSVFILKDLSLINTDAAVGNLNRNQTFIEDTVSGHASEVAGTWTQLPNGLYYSNYYTGANDASLDTTGGGTGKYKHQILVPLSFPEYTSITSIAIPIYLKNVDAGSSKTFKTSGSIILGNGSTAGNVIEYLTDSTSFELSTSTIAASSEDTITLASAVSDFGEKFISPTRNGGSFQPCQRPYLLLALWSVDDSVAANVIFAIPYVRVKFTY